ncbi:hypothetical protein HYH03_000458 [Edaphochlamys debaryana]|uniref:Uncharacterized protein n=1 Tax=Edaphochlamys debaryana TaxID=47281 RepID=A0A835YFP9_9CHLO|nr:hypothetical protein HYH03_000458 [Edaphochlamys debaryana]|eukprot:KAG2501960.1 hypothetical protein HYH03_000458 [Edaphochlamys debaryana]
MGGSSTVTKASYYAAGQILCQGILTTALAGAEPAVSPSALDAAWQEDAAGADSLSRERLRTSLAALATACSADATPVGAAAVLSAMLDKLKGQGERWRSLLARYGSSSGGGGGTARTMSSQASADDLFGDDDAEADVPDVAPAKDLERKSAKSAKSGKSSKKSSKKSLKSVGGDPDLSDDGEEGDDGDLPPADLDAADVAARRASNAAAGSSKAGGRQPLLKGLMSSEEGKGHLADLPMDLKSWEQFKGKGAGAAATGPPPGAKPPGASLPARSSMQKPLASMGSKPAPPPLQPRGEAPPLVPHSSKAIQLGGNSQLRFGAGQLPGGPSRHLGRDLSRKHSISEPAPTGQQAAWRHLPTLGQGAKLHPHPHELRQPSQGNMRGPSMRTSPTASTSSALLDDKLPSLPALAGGRGAMPKAMELMRRPSHKTVDVAGRADSYHPGAGSPGHLPGLGAGRGPQGPRGRIASKKSFRGDLDF